MGNDEQFVQETQDKGKAIKGAAMVDTPSYVCPELILMTTEKPGKGWKK